MKRRFFPLLFLLLAGSVLAEQVFQKPADFVSEAFGGQPPKASLLWLNKAMQKDIAQILGHRLRSLRLRYWAEGERSVWILDEIGKEHPITTGIVVDNGRIEKIRVLIYRESRGHEVRHAFFTDQFKEATLTADRQLDRPIDGISGATLSVRALTRLARLALYLDQRRRAS